MIITIKRPGHFINIQNLLVFLFCGAVVGETLALSMVVTRLGPPMVGKLYLVNAVILLLIPPVFFRYIDKVDRGKLLGWLLLGTIITLTAMLMVYQIFNQQQLVIQSILVSLYPVAYLSKTVLFLTFWTFLNDIYTIQDAKKRFPVIAAWGFGGALAGVVLGRVFITVVTTQLLMILWILVYVVAWLFSRRLGVRFKKRLRPVEDIPWVSKRLFGLEDLLQIRLVRIMSLFYFLTFFAIFSIDFIFWKRCSEWFKTAEEVASFQFTFYIIHAAVTIVLLRFALPKIIAKIGFTRVLYGLPLMLFTGGLGLLTVAGENGKNLSFPVSVSVQFFRYIFFEITFAPLYQLFYAAIVKERRGRAKTFLEGVVKPLAILSSGMFLVAGLDNYRQLALIVATCGVALWVIIYYLRRVYRSTMMNERSTSPGIEELIEDAGQQEDLQLYELIERYALAPDADLRTVAVHLLRQLGTVRAFEALVALYGQEREHRIREMIARSMGTFYNYRTKPFIEKMLDENDYRIRANAIFALNQMHCNWKKHLTARIGPLLFESNLRVQLEAARFIWENGSAAERTTVMHFLKSLLGSNETDRKSAGIYLVGTLQTDGWEAILVDNLHSALQQVYRKSLDVLFENGSDTVRLQALSTIDVLSRTHISVTGRVIERIGVSMMDTLVSFIPLAKSRRMKFEMIGCLKGISDTLQQSGAKVKIPRETEQVIERWIVDEMKKVYLDAFVFNRLKHVTAKTTDWEILENALREKQLRICEWAMAAVVLTGTKNEHNWRFTEMDIYNQTRREELIEVFESVGREKIGTLAVAFLKLEEWEKLSRIGKNYFHFIDRDINDGLSWFLKSENRLITLSTLYTIEKNRIAYFKNQEITGVLKMLSYHKHELVSSAAVDLLENSPEEHRRRGKAFILLESVLFFKGMRLFSGIGADKLLHLVEIARLVEFQREEIISMQGRVSDQMYIVKKGGMRIETKIGGQDEIVAYIKEGETYGEVGLFSRSVRNATAFADEKSEVYIIKGADIKRLVREIPEVAFNFLEAISKRLVDGVEKEKILR